MQIKLTRFILSFAFFALSACGTGLNPAAPGNPGDQNVPPGSTGISVESVDAQSLPGTYIIGEKISLQVKFSDDVQVSKTPRIYLNIQDDNNFPVYAVYESGSGSDTLIFSYTIQEGDSQLTTGGNIELAFNPQYKTIQTAAFGAKIEGQGNGQAVDNTLPSETRFDINIDALPPKVTEIGMAEGAPTVFARSGDVVDLDVTFSEIINVAGEPIFNVTGNRKALFSSGSDTSVLRFRYTVVDGDSVSNLTYLGESALNMNGAFIRDEAGNVASALLPANNSFGDKISGLNVHIETAIPVITSVSTSFATGTYGIGTAIPLTVNFSRNVLLSKSASLRMTLNTTPARAAVFTNSDANNPLNSNVFTFTYTVTEGDNIPNPGALRPTNFIVSGGGLVDAVTNVPADLSIDTLTVMPAISIDGTKPFVTNLSAASPPIGREGYGKNQTVALTVTFPATVIVAGNFSSPPSIALGNNGRVANYVGGSGTNSLLFNYIVQSGDSTGGGFLSIPAAPNNVIALNGCTIRDLAQNDANPTLPAGDISGNIKVEASDLVITSVTENMTNGTFGTLTNTGAGAGTLVFTAYFNRAATASELPGVQMTGMFKYRVRSALFDDVTDPFAQLSSGSGSMQLTFKYTVQPYDGAASLLPSTIVGTFTDTFGNVMLDSEKINLSSKIVRSGTDVLQIYGNPPFVQSMSSTVAAGSYTTGKNIDVNVVFSESVKSAANALKLTLNSKKLDLSNVELLTTAASATLRFPYIVTSGDSTNGAALYAKDVNALTMLSPVTSVDASNQPLNAADLTLPAWNSGIVVDARAPVAPTNTTPVVSAASAGSYTINLAWTKSADSDVIGYVLYSRSGDTGSPINPPTAVGTSPAPLTDRSGPPVEWRLSPTIGATQVTFSDRVPARSTFTYSIWAYDSAFNFSPMLTQTVVGDTAGPNAVTNVTAAGSAPAGGVRNIGVNWTKSTSSDAVGTLLVRRQGAVASSLIPVNGTAPGSQTFGGTAGDFLSSADINTFTDTNRIAITDYTYSAWAYDGAYNYSPINSVTVFALSTRPATVSGLFYYKGAGPGSIVLNWTASADAASGYIIRRTTGVYCSADRTAPADGIAPASQGSVYAVLPAGSVSYSDSNVGGLNPGTQVCYTIWACDGAYLYSTSEPGVLPEIVVDLYAWNFAAYAKGTGTTDADSFGGGIKDMTQVGASGSGGQSVAAAVFQREVLSFFDETYVLVGAPLSNNSMQVIQNLDNTAQPDTDGIGNSDWGEVYVFKSQDNATWDQDAILRPGCTCNSCENYSIKFGFSVALANGMAAVGAPFNDKNLSDNNPNDGFDCSGTNNQTTDMGEVWIYSQNKKSGDWSVRQRLKSSNYIADDYAYLGWSLALSERGTYLAVGAPGAVNNTGAALLYQRSGSTYTSERIINASNYERHTNDNFGYSIAASEATIAVGAPSDGCATSTGPTPLVGTCDATARVDSGVVHLFDATTGAWQYRLKSPTAAGYEYFGTSVAISSDVIVVGAPGDDGDESTISNAPDMGYSGTAVESGSAYVYRRNGANWVYEARLKVPHNTANDRFGWSVAVEGDVVVVGALFEDSTPLSTVTNGPTHFNDSGKTDSGAAYIFRRFGTTWKQDAFLKSYKPAGTDSTNLSGINFGASVAVDRGVPELTRSGGNMAAVGVPKDTHQLNGITQANGQNSFGFSFNANDPNSGAVYFFKK